jgi:hypothetical protein
VRTSLLLGTGLLFFLRCGSAPTTAPDPQAELERLRALGYVGFTETKVESGQAVVPLHEEALSAPGYNLISNRDLTTAQLFDARGTVVHAWADPGAKHWSNAELLPDGDLLVTGSETPDEERSNFLLRLAWDGSVVWRAPISAHHDAELTPAGTIATLTFRMRRIPAISAEREVKDHELTLLSADGQLLEQHSLYDMLCSSPEIFSCTAPTETQVKESFIDLLHANSLEFMRHPHLAQRHALYAATNVLVSFRHQDAVAIFDWPAKKLVWAWGPGQISGQHDARVLENGNILIFDNGIARSRSRVIELDPLSRAIVWEYGSAESERFFSLRKGSSQRLENGNTLVASSDSGEAFEVTPAGRMVWRFVNPNADAEGRRATIVRIHRYPVPFVQELLARHGEPR